MFASKNLVAYAFGIAAMAQYSQAAIIAGILGVTAEVATTAVAGVAGSAIAAGGAVGAAAVSKSSRFKRDLPAGVSQESANQCLDSLSGVVVNFTPQDNNGVLVDNLPAPCMNLATVIAGDYDAGNPVPMSSSSILFSGLSDDELNDIQSFLN